MFSLLLDCAGNLRCSEAHVTSLWCQRSDLPAYNSKHTLPYRNPWIEALIGFQMKTPLLLGKTIAFSLPGDKNNETSGRSKFSLFAFYKESNLWQYMRNDILKV